jgi:hypothetical protein
MLRNTRSLQVIAGGKPKPFLLKASVARKRKPKGLAALLQKFKGAKRAANNRRPRREMDPLWVYALN